MEYHRIASYQIIAYVCPTYEKKNFEMHHKFSIIKEESMYNWGKIIKERRVWLHNSVP